MSRYQQGASQPEVGQSGTAAAGDALTREDSEKQTSALGYSLLSLQKRVHVGPGDLPAEQLDILGQGNGRKRYNGAATDLWARNKQRRNRREQEHLQYRMGDGMHT